MKQAKVTLIKQLTDEDRNKQGSNLNLNHDQFIFRSPRFRSSYLPY